MKIKSAEFVISNTNVSKCPTNQLPEYTFIGRSNVGKSSLINMLTGKKKLAKTSGTPGKTQLINHFKINNNWFLVDLPGYGSVFQKFIKDYFEQRQQLICTFVMVDCRLEPQKMDLEFMEYLGKNNIPFCIVFTKADKLKPLQLNKNIQHYTKVMISTTWESMPTHFVTSATSKTGKEELLNFIDNLNQEVTL